MSLEDKIKNSELLVNTIGRFPTFHDSEVVQLVLDRGEGETIWEPFLLAKIRVMKLVNKDDGEGNYIWGYHLVVLRFFNIDDVNLQGFNLQNVLFDLHIDEIPAPELTTTRYEVVFVSCYGVGMEFTCSETIIESVGPLEIIKNQPVDDKTRQERQKLVDEHLRRVRGLN